MERTRQWNFASNENKTKCFYYLTTDRNFHCLWKHGREKWFHVLRCRWCLQQLKSLDVPNKNCETALLQDATVTLTAQTDRQLKFYLHVCLCCEERTGTSVLTLKKTATLFSWRSLARSLDSLFLTLRDTILRSPSKQFVNFLHINRLFGSTKDEKKSRRDKRDNCRVLFNWLSIVCSVVL